ncbi:DUF1801 domain-containing protein [Arthrobacter sp. Soil736]|uniref:DUF1801 domain-containing protein n=1 Tax=Arthrobacter sp. Soil736 TaxID=1736395 RepID=UPI000A9F3CEB|nr:DUF1801 domain-containing protein [Arthrobacter sp. Soil736]
MQQLVQPEYMTLSPRGSKQSAGRYGTWCTLPIPPSRKQSSEPPAIRRPEWRHLRPARGKDHVNVFLYDGGIVPDPEQIITAGHNNKTARTVAFREGEAVNERALGEMFRTIIAHNRAGGWRMIKGSQ